MSTSDPCARFEALMPRMVGTSAAAYRSPKSTRLSDGTARASVSRFVTAEAFKSSALRAVMLYGTSDTSCRRRVAVTTTS